MYQLGSLKLGVKRGKTCNRCMGSAGKHVIVISAGNHLTRGKRGKIPRVLKLILFFPQLVKQWQVILLLHHLPQSNTTGNKWRTGTKTLYTPWTVLAVIVFAEITFPLISQTFPKHHWRSPSMRENSRRLPSVRKYNTNIYEVVSKISDDFPGWEIFQIVLTRVNL